MHGWQTILLPYLEEEALFKTIKFDLPWNHPDNAVPFQGRLQLYMNPRVTEQKDASEYALSHYASNARVIGGNVPVKLSDITDGTSNTILAGEAAGNYKPWGHPRNWRDPALGLNRSPDGFGSKSSRGVQMVMADGSVRTLSSKTSLAVLRALSTPNGGEV